MDFSQFDVEKFYKTIAMLLSQRGDIEVTVEVTEIGAKRRKAELEKSKKMTHENKNRIENNRNVES